MNINREILFSIKNENPCTEFKANNYLKEDGGRVCELSIEYSGKTYHESKIVLSHEKRYYRKAGKDLAQIIKDRIRKEIIDNMSEKQLRQLFEKMNQQQLRVFVKRNTSLIRNSISNL